MGGGGGSDRTALDIVCLYAERVTSARCTQPRADGASLATCTVALEHSVRGCGARARCRVGGAVGSDRTALRVARLRIFNPQSPSHLSS